MRSLKQKPLEINSLKHISFDVQRGEILVLMGLSGSGKSSLLRCLNGVHQVAKIDGHIVFTPTNTTAFDFVTEDTRTLRPVIQKNIAMVFQSNPLLPWRTIEENVTLPLEFQNQKLDLDFVASLLEMVGLLSWRKAYPKQLSGGMQQRVCLARALVTRPPVLLLDEPFSALDPLNRRRLQDELLHIHQKTLSTMIFVTHDFEEALRIGDRIAILHDGHLLQIGPSASVLNCPEHPLVEEFVNLQKREKAG
jgi:glycine betaine/proline transport system ATP-binding protein